MQRFDQFNLRTKLGLGFAALIVLTIAVGAVAVMSQQRALEMVDSYLGRESASVELSVKAFAEVLEARRYEHGFLLHLRDFSFEEARARYASLVRFELADARKSLESIGARDASVLPELQQLQRELDTYRDGFLRIVDKFDELRDVDSGLQTRLRAESARMESLLASGAPAPLSASLALLRSTERGLARGDTAGEARWLADVLAQLRRDLAKADIGSDRASELGMSITRYMRLVERYAALAEEIDEELIAHSSDAYRVTSLLELVQNRAVATADAARGALSGPSQVTRVTVAVACLAAIALALLVAVALTRNIGRTIRTGVVFADRLAQGDLATRVDWKGDKEFGTLISALNGMADSMQIADRLEGEHAAALHRVNRTLRVLSQCNCTLVRATSEHELLQSIAEHIVETGGFRRAWVGFPEHDERRRVKPVGYAGDRDGIGPDLDVTWADDARGQGVTGTAIREDRTVIVHDVFASPEHAPWRSLAIAGGVRSAIALPLRGKNGFGVLSIYAAELSAFDDDEVKLLEELAADLAYGILALREAEARQRYETQLAYQNNYDPTTGAANRNLFRDRVEQALLHAARNGTLAAVLSLGIDRFGTVNDGLGQSAGDRMLKLIAERIASCVHEDDTVARLDGDTFGVAINFVHREEDIARTARRMMQTIEESMVIDGTEIFPSVSLGVSVYPRDGADTERQLKNSRAAMQSAKALGGGQFRYYAPEMNERASARFGLEAELRRALERDELVLHYQPKASLANGRLTGAEALVRWNHPTRGLVMPGEFIAVAEEAGLIEPLGRWVIDRVCAQLSQWRIDGLPVPAIAVNLSARQFRQEDLVDFIQATVRKHGIEPQLLEFKLTESTVMHDVESGIGVLRRLKGAGVKVSLDDFGTGHSSLSNLKRLPIDKLKIDQSFVRDITTDPENAAVCVAVIGLAHTLKLTVVAEGVETEGQMNYLRRNHCDELQGHIFGRAVPAADFARLLASGHSLKLPVDGGNNGTQLIVDDESNVLSALRRALRTTGHRILTAGSALEGFEILATNDVQVVISDQRMPQMNGTEFLSRVRDLYPDTIRIVLSGYTDVDTILESINRGTVFRFLTKPWDDTLLLEHINDAFRYHRVTSKRENLQAAAEGYAVVEAAA